MKAPAFMQAMPSRSLADVDGHLILSGAAPDAFETILPQWVPAGLWRRGLWNWEGTLGGILVFSSGLTVLLPPPGFDRRVLLPSARGNWIPWSGIISD